jgi:hypothetical protein
MKLLFIGCGELGRRHIQAASQLKGKNKIFIVDPSNDAKTICKAIIDNTKRKNIHTKYQWYSDLYFKCDNFDLCIISTHAAERAGLVIMAHKLFNINKFLIEKIISNSLGKILELNTYAIKHKLNIWVNCKTRTYEIHKQIKDNIVNSNQSCSEIHFQCTSGNWGLVTNAIHAIDLFAFFDNTKSLTLKYSKFENNVYITKRGTYDINGTLFGVSNTLSTLFIEFNSFSKSPDTYSITTSNGKFIVDHTNQITYSSKPENNWTWHKENFEENIFVSHMSIKFITDITKNNCCDLPSLQESIISHEFLLSSVTEIFRDSLKLTNEELPVA